MRGWLNNLIVVTQQDADRTVITVAGEMGLDTCPTLARATLAIPLGRTLHLEMSGVSFMDSRGLNLLLQQRRRFLAEGGQLTAADLQDQPVQVLRLTGAYDLLVPGTTSTGRGACRCSGIR
ncbi:STAS domain-containing protein [Streptomyces sp. NPDC086787]|uniref:STAS domain-containing protein n=1 Tax=Streptomyces sp. NPDC086787 TaxID=3365759 RepID=UPI003815F070